MPRRLSDWLPNSTNLLGRTKSAIASAIVVSLGLAHARVAAAEANSRPSASPTLEPTVVRRSKRIGKVLLRLPGTRSGLLAQHRSHSSHASHASHASGSTGVVRTPVAPAAPAPVAMPSTVTSASVAAPLLSTSSRPAVLGVVQKIDPVTHMVTIKDETPLEATIEFFYDGETKFTPLGGISRILLDGATLPIALRQKVSIQWVPHPVNASRKIAVVIVERR